MTSLRRRMTEDMQVLNFAPCTQFSYLYEVSRFARHFGKSPDLLGPAEVRAYCLYLIQDKHLAASSITVALSAIRFLYKVTLKRGWNFEDDIPSRRVPRKLPVVLSQQEVGQFLDAVRNLKHRVILTTCYAAGLRVSEAVHLKPPAIDSQRMVIRVEQGKGRKDRYVMLSPRLLELLRDYWRQTHPRVWLFPGSQPDQPTSRLTVEWACREARERSGSPSRSRRIRCATPLPTICWRPAPTYAPSSFCWVTGVCAPRPSICTSPPSRSALPPAHWMG